MMFRKTIATILSVMIALGLSPTSAIADDGSDLAAGSAVTTQAAMKTVWVITKASQSSNTDWYLPTTYKYNKNGLISKTTMRHKQRTSDGKSVTLSNISSNKYDTYGKLTKTVSTQSGQAEKTSNTYSYCDNGAIAKQTFDTPSFQYVTKFTSNAAGQVTRIAHQTASGGSADGVYLYYESHKLSYYKTGRISKATQLKTTYRNGKKWKTDEAYRATAFSYDKKGNVTKVKHTGSYGYTATYKNTYKSGRLIKRTLSGTNASSPNTYSYTYKKLTIPAKYADAVAQQQRELLNPAPTNIGVWEYL